MTTRFEDHRPDKLDDLRRVRRSTRRSVLSAKRAWLSGADAPFRGA